MPLQAGQREGRRAVWRLANEALLCALKWLTSSVKATELKRRVEGIQRADSAPLRLTRWTTQSADQQELVRATRGNDVAASGPFVPEQHVDRS